MGIYYSGGMIVGNSGGDVSEPEEYEGDFQLWLEENGMDSMSLHFDADQDSQIVGFAVKDILVSDIDEKWIEDIRAKSAKFEELTGVPAKLIGTQDIW